jgi:DNA methylase/ParB/Sulfiredoxin domain
MAKHDAHADITHETVALSALQAHPRNYRRHPQQQIERLRASLRRFGQVRSIVAQRGVHTFLVVAGHGVVEAAREEGYATLRADVIPATWTAEQIEGYLIADNEHSRGADDDQLLLAEMLREQESAGADLLSLGYSPDELEALLQELGDEHLRGQAREVDDPDGGGDDFDTTPEEGPTRCQPGDLWQLGRHRLLCGDSTRREDVERLMGGARAVLMATDPPYGDSWVDKARDMQKRGYVHSHAVLRGSIQNDDRTGDDLTTFLGAFLEAAKSAGDAPMPFYVWHRAKRRIFEQSLIDAGYFVHQPVIWVKPGFVIGRMHYHPRCEWALHGWRQGNGVCPFYGERNQSDVWEVGRENDKIHPTQKPVALFLAPITNHTREGEVVYEPFAGSGTQYVAAERLGRACCGIEIDPRYCDVILRRWEAETGETATLLSRLDGADHGAQIEIHS